MKILFEDQWLDGFLDEALLPDSVRVQPLIWINVCEVKDAFIEPKRSIRYVYNYIKDIGLRNVALKIKSRTKESIRNKKYVSFGIGKAIDASYDIEDMKGKFVMFIAPFHAKCMERVVLPITLIRPYTGTVSYESDKIIFYDIRQRYENYVDEYVIDKIKGWSRFSGKKIDQATLGYLFSAIDDILIGLKNNEIIHKKMILPVGSNDGVAEYSNTAEHYKTQGPKKRALLFAYGNYSKTMIIPNLSKYVHVARIHEIDPTQIGNKTNVNDIVFDTSPNLRYGEIDKYDVVIAAGYHHTHAPIAITALESNKNVIIEKPIATNESDLERLLNAMRTSKGRVFIGFQRRYSDFNNYIYRDMSINKGEPINYHAIVFEVPLPHYHWYRWPNSHSRLVSNGCHWIDHFLFLNNYCDVVKQDAIQAKDGTIMVCIELENGALFTMTLTDVGANSIGLRDYIELRHGHCTIKIVDNSLYIAENDNGLIRKLKRNKLHAHANMYKYFGQRLLSNLPGDDIDTTEKSARIVLKLEELLI